MRVVLCPSFETPEEPSLSDGFLISNMQLEVKLLKLRVFYQRYKVLLSDEFSAIEIRLGNQLPDLRKCLLALKYNYTMIGQIF